MISCLPLIQGGVFSAAGALLNLILIVFSDNYCGNRIRKAIIIISICIIIIGIIITYIGIEHILCEKVVNS